MTRFLSLSSGSNGNCYYIGNNETALVIDMGIGGRTLKKRLLDNGIPLESIDMILVTHDHIDHIRSLGSVAQRLSVPVFATEKLHNSLDRHPCTKDYINGCKRVIKKECCFEHRGVRFTPFEVPHDATETVGFFIDFFGDKFVFMTDLGSVPECAYNYIKQADYLIIESNFDTDLLMEGTYPLDLKMRILQGHGHLSNDQCHKALKRAYHPGLRYIFLCHLSENNNTPERAYRSAYSALESLGVRVGADTKLICLPRKECSPLFNFYQQ